MADGRTEAGEGKSTAATEAPEVASSSSSSQADADDLVEALHLLFTRFAGVVRGELQCSNSEYELLKDMNLRTTTEYDNFGDFASGLRVFVERLKHKNDNLNKYLEEIDGIDHQVTELEALVSTLDKYTNTLHAQIKGAFADS